MDHTISLQGLKYMEAHKLLQGKSFCTVAWIISSVQGPRENHQCKSLLFFFASFNIRRRRKLCQGGVDIGDNDETMLLNHVGALSDD